MNPERRIPEWTQIDAADSIPAVLLPYQQRWVADQSPVKICEKSRRVGISWAEAADDTLFAASASGDDVWYIGYNLDMAREFINDCADWARVFNKVASAVEEVVLEDEDKEILSLRINFPSGHRVTALSSRPTNLRGKQGRVVIDEAAFHDDLPGLIKAAMALLMWGGSVRIISTHLGDGNPFNEVINDVRAGKRPYSIHRITLDDALEDGLYRRICLKLDREWTPEAEAAWRQDLVDFYGDDADEELFCVPGQGSGIYFTRMLIEKQMRDDIPLLRWGCKNEFATLPEHIRIAEARDWCEATVAPLLPKLDATSPHYFGEDFGRSSDLTVIWPLAQVRNLKLRTPFLLELRNVPFRQQEQILFYLLDRLPRFRGGAMDARGNGQYLAEVAMQRYGAERIAQVMLSETWYRENMPRYKAAFEDEMIDLPKDSDILDDHRAVQVVRGVPKIPDGRGQGQDGGKRHGDSAVAGALAVYAVHNVSGYEIEFKTAPDSLRTSFGRSMSNFLRT